MNEHCHLSEAVKATIDLPDAERIAGIRKPRWIGHPYAKTILDKLEQLLAHPRMHRMPNLLIVADTNNGKTMTVNRFHRLHPAADNVDGDIASVPVLLLQAPAVPNENRFYNAMFDSLGHPYRASQPAGRKVNQILHLLPTVGVRMLIIDEIHHLLAGSTNKQREFLNVLKYLGNELQTPIVGVGTKDAIRAIQTDPQLANRFEPTGIPHWSLDRDFRMLLASFESVLPLRAPSRLSEQGLATRLLAMSEGTIGELFSLLTSAAILAIRTGQERIDSKLLDELKWVPPSERRRVIERLE